MLQINWTISASRQRVNILLFWIEHNKSNIYSNKILGEITRIEKLLLNNHFLGQKTDIEGVRRVLVLKNFSIYYVLKDDSLEVIGFKDNRRDQKDLDIK